MNKIFLGILKTYIIIALPLGILFVSRQVYLTGYIIGIFIGLLDLLLIFMLLRKKGSSLNYSSIIVGMMMRLAVISVIVSILLFCDIINRLSILGLLIGLAMYPLALLIGGLKVLKWKR
jgi:hypothetical protein